MRLQTYLSTRRELMIAKKVDMFIVYALSDGDRLSLWGFQMHFMIHKQALEKNPVSCPLTQGLSPQHDLRVKSLRCPYKFLM